MFRAIDGLAAQAIVEPAGIEEIRSVKTALLETLDPNGARRKKKEDLSSKSPDESPSYQQTYRIEAPGPAQDGGDPDSISPGQGLTKVSPHAPQPSGTAE
jgi:hypothetical protein